MCGNNGEENGDLMNNFYRSEIEDTLVNYQLISDAVLNICFVLARIESENLIRGRSDCLPCLCVDSLAGS